MKKLIRSIKLIFIFYKLSRLLKNFLCPLNLFEFSKLTLYITTDKFHEYF
jgi:hypothetical protein